MKRVVFGLFISMFVLMSCEDDDGGSNASSSFNRKAMLENYANNLILPRIDSAVLSANALYNTVENYLSDPTEGNKTLAQQEWRAAAKDYVRISAYNFGPGDGLFGTLNENLGTFPADTVQIEAYIRAGDNSLDNFNRSTRGYYALEYLLFEGNEPLTVNRKAYMAAVMTDMTSRLEQLNQGWSSFVSDFTQNDATNAGSSTSVLFNQFALYFETSKNFKVGLPAGKRPGQTAAAPEQVESYYAGYSKELLNIHLEEVWNIYTGTGVDGEDGQGLADYLKASPGGEAIFNQTVEQWNNVLAANQAVYQTNQAFQDIVVNEPVLADELYMELQRHTRFFKSDLSSILGIQITYQSGDGD